MSACSAYPTDASDEEWASVAPYLTLLPEDASQRKYPLQEAFNGARYMVKSCAPGGMTLHDLPSRLFWWLLYFISGYGYHPWRSGMPCAATVRRR